MKDRQRPQGFFYQGEWFPFAPMGGGADGYADTRDLVTADNIPVNRIYAEIDNILEQANQRLRDVEMWFSTVVESGIFRDTRQVGSIQWEEGSEYGRPAKQHVTETYTDAGLPIRSYKVATGWTREYLAFRTADELRREASAFVRSDADLQALKTLQTVFDNLAGSTTTFFDPQLRTNLTVRAPLVNADGWVPPMFENVTFAGTHDHYFVSGTTAVSAANVETLRLALDEHGWRGRRYLFINDAERADIDALTDFVAILDPNITLGPGSTEVMPNLPRGLPTIGQGVIGYLRNTGFFVNVWNQIPAGYVVAFDSNGPKPVARREWPGGNPLRGLRVIRPGAETTYRTAPVEEAYWERWVGWGGNLGRTNGAVMQVKASGTYDVPDIDGTVLRET